MVCERLFEKIDELKDEYLDLLEDICKIESPTDDKEAVDRCGRYFVEFAKKNGWRYEVFPEKVSGDVVTLILNPDAKKAPVTISAHLDTVHPIGLFKEPVVWRDDKNMYGPGVVDCKGGAAAGLLAMKALEEVGFCERPVLLILQSDEEKGSTPSEKRTINHICERAKGSVAFLNGEMMTQDKLIVTRKGILRYRIDVTGIAVHSSVCYRGKSAILEASHKIIEFERIKDKEGVTYNCGVISGGTTPNTVAEKCSFFVDIRYNDSKELEEAKRRVSQITETSYIGETSAMATLVSERPSMDHREENFALLDKVNEIFKSNNLHTAEAHHGLGGSDAAYTTLAEIPTLDSIGPMGGRGHSVEEFMILDDFSECAKRLAAIAYCI